MTRISVNLSTVYTDTLVAIGLIYELKEFTYNSRNSSVRSDHKAIIASSGERQVLTQKKGRTAKFRKIGPRPIAAFISHMKDFHFVRNFSLSTQVEFDSFYDLLWQLRGQLN